LCFGVRQRLYIKCTAKLFTCNMYSRI
jgi:hypothetical protein